MDEEAVTPPNPSGRAATIRRLTRSSEGRVVAGVARGLGEYTGMDPVVFRIAFIVLTIAGGAGILAYLLAWLVIPLDTASSAPGEAIIQRLRGSRVMAALFIGVGLLVFASFYTGFSSPVIVAIALIAAGIVLLRDDPPSAVSKSPVAADRAAEGTAEESEPVITKRPRSPLGLYTLGSALLAIGIAAALVGGDVISIQLGQYFAIALTIIGAGLVVGAWWGWSRLLILAGVMVIPLMLASSVIKVPLTGTLGDRYVQGRKQFADHYEVLAGSITLDFSRYRFGEIGDVFDVDMAVGHLRVYVPPGVAVHVSGSIDAGQTRFFGESRNGFDLAFRETFERRGSTEGDLFLNVQGGLTRVTTTWAWWVEDEIRFREQQRQKRLEKRRAERADERATERPRAKRGNRGN